MEKRPIPYGFEEVAEMGQSFLMHKFHCSHSQIKRWRKEIGIKHRGKTAKRPITQYDKAGRMVRRCKSLHEAARRVDGQASNIWKCVNGKIPTAYGYVWRYGGE